MDGRSLMSNWPQEVTNGSFLKDMKLAAGRHEENWRSWREEMVGRCDQCSWYKCFNKKVQRIKNFY